MYNKRAEIGRELLGPFINVLYRRYGYGSVCLQNVVYSEPGEYVGDVDHANFLIKKGITHFVQPLALGETCCIGFCEDEQKWYGWSHRAILGFGVGSKVAKGDCAFKPSNKEEAIEAALAFWEIDGIWRECETPEITCTNMLQSIEPSIEAGVAGTKIKCKRACRGADRDFSSEYFVPYPLEWGRGEWEAKTLLDAIQMAMDFAEGVS